MNITLKTARELKADGWKDKNNRLSLGPYSSDSISRFGMRHLGKTGRILDVELDGDPKARVKFGEHKDWYSWRAFKNPNVIERWGSQIVKKRFLLNKNDKSDSITHEPDGYFTFGCDLKLVHKSDLLPILKWLAGRLGFRLVKNTKK